MKNIFLLTLLFSFYSYTSGQTLQHNYSPYIYLGAPKEPLIDLVVETAKAYYQQDIGGLIKQQKKKGIKLKKKSDLDAFLVKMEADIRSKLVQSNAWDEVNLETSWLLHITEIIGLDFKLPGLTDGGGYRLKRDLSLRDYVILRFKNDEINQIYAFINVATLRHVKDVFLYNNQTLQLIVNQLNKTYGTNYKHSRIAGEDFLGEKSYPGYSETFYYATKPIEIIFRFSYKPAGRQDKAGNWSHWDATLQKISFTALSR